MLLQIEAEFSKSMQPLQIGADLLQIRTAITNRGYYYKSVQNTQYFPFFGMNWNERPYDIIFLPQKWPKINVTSVLYPEERLGSAIFLH